MRPAARSDDDDPMIELLLLLGILCALCPRGRATWLGPTRSQSTQSSIDLMDAAAKARPFSFRKPWVASSAEMARSDMRPPLGFCR
jgi:hypothetical protein